MSLDGVALGATSVGGAAPPVIQSNNPIAAHRSVLVSFPAAFPADELPGKSGF